MWNAQPVAKAQHVMDLLSFKKGQQNFSCISTKNKAGPTGFEWHVGK